MWRLYGGKEYEFILSAENSGPAPTEGWSCTLDYDPARLEVSWAGDPFPSLQPGEKAERTLRIIARLTEAVEHIPLNITLTGGGKTLEDQFLFRFYREEVRVDMVNDGISTTAVILVPGSQGYVFAAASSGSISLPWSEGEYLIAIKQTGYPWEDHKGKGAFWLGFNAEMTNVADVLNSIVDREITAPMDTIDTATARENVREIRGFVHENDIDFYKLRLGEGSGGFIPIGD
jgi:hypothetical protein